MSIDVKRPFLAVALLASLAACGAQEPVAQARLRVVTPYSVKSLDPIKQGFWASEWGYGELLMRPTERGTVEPWLLASLTRHGESAWTLTLRQGVRFQSGRALDAVALKELMEAHLAQNPAVRSALEGAKVAVTGPLAVRLETGEPVANLPSLLADESMFSVFDVASRTFTGPFEVKSLDSRKLVLARDPGYWGGKVRLDGVEVRFVPDGQARTLAVRSGEADLAFYPPTDALRTLKGDARVSIREAALATGQLRGFLNVRKAPLDDSRVRRALSLAVDRKELAETVMDGFYRTPSGVYPEALPYSVKNLRTELPAAERLLEEAGWRRGADGTRARDGRPLAITINAYSPQPDTKPLAVAMQAQLAKAGFRVKVAEVPENYAAMRSADGWDVGLSFDGSLSYGFDPVAPLAQMMRTKGPRNLGGIADPGLDQVIDGLAGAFEPAERDRLLREAQRIAVEEQAYHLIVVDRVPRVVAGPRYRDYRPSSVLLHLDASTAPCGDSCGS
ncbi:ABC transporter substrate-binding protein [Nonomuraea dietziae]|uniref:ABC transporter substrate-binding protein n=1 Tax=Nonomuraea dietziae TaxID=65515 RepID=UPI003433162A